MPSNGAMAFRCNQTGSRKISSKLRYGWNLSRYACLSADVAKSRRSRELDCCIWCAYDHIRIYRVHAVVHFAELLLLHRLKMANTNEIELCCRIVGIQHDSAGFFLLDVEAYSVIKSRFCPFQWRKCGCAEEISRKWEKHRESDYTRCTRKYSAQRV